MPWSRASLHSGWRRWPRRRCWANPRRSAAARCSAASRRSPGPPCAGSRPCCRSATARSRTGRCGSGRRRAGSASWDCTASVLEIFLLDKPAAVQHVQEVGVAAGVELVGGVELDAAVLEQPGQGAVDDRRADLGLDVVADAGQALLLESLGPGGVADDEDRDAVDERHARVQGGLGVELGGLLRADRQIVHQDLRLRCPAVRRSRRPVGRRPARSAGAPDSPACAAESRRGRDPSARRAGIVQMGTEDLRVVGRREDRLARPAGRPCGDRCRRPPPPR